MSLILELVSSGSAQAPAADRKVFGAGGGTLGRAKHNDLVLPDGKVSARHARISCQGSQYFIEDTSTNGTYLNSPSNRLSHGQPMPLHAGDRVIIEPYELRVAAVEPSIVEAAKRSPASAVDLTVDDPFRLAQAPPSSSFPEKSADWAAAAVPLLTPTDDDVVDPLQLLGAPRPVRQESKAKPPTAQDLESRSPLEAHYRPPAVSPPARPTPPAPVNVIPLNYDPLAPETKSAGFDDLQALTPPPAEGTAPPPISESSRVGVPPRPTPPPSPSPSPSPGRGVAAETPRPAPSPTPDGADFTTVLAAAGISAADVTPELARQFGEILRVVVVGVMDVLRSRHFVKDEFRMHVTHVRPADNNPLKFSANVDDALHNLLVKRNPAYLGPVDAFRDAFDDLRMHQLAMLAGMRVAFETTLAAFDPDRLEEQFDRHKKPGGLLALNAKSRYWDLFRGRREEWKRDPEACFRELFGEAFADAYEAQLKRLKESPRRV